MISEGEHSLSGDELADLLIEQSDVVDELVNHGVHSKERRYPPKILRCAWKELC